MADGRNADAAKKGWQTRHARQRMLKDAQDFAAVQQNMSNEEAATRLGAAYAQNFTNASQAQKNYVTLQEAEQVYQRDEAPEARKDRLAKLKAWWRWFYYGE